MNQCLCFVPLYNQNNSWMTLFKLKTCCHVIDPCQGMNPVFVTAHKSFNLTRESIVENFKIMPNQVLHSGEREIVLSVYRACLEEKETNVPLKRILQPADRAAAYCGVSRATVFRIKKEKTDRPNVKLNTPGKNR